MFWAAYRANLGQILGQQTVFGIGRKMDDKTVSRIKRLKVIKNPVFQTNQVTGWFRPLSETDMHKHVASLIFSTKLAVNSDTATGKIVALT